MSWGTKASMESMKKCLKEGYKIKPVQGYYAVQCKSPKSKGKNVLEFRIKDNKIVADIESNTLTECEWGNFDKVERLNYKGWTKDLRVYCSYEWQVKGLMTRAYEYFENKYM